MSSKKIGEFPKENSVLWSTVCSVFSNFMIKRASVHKLHYLNPNAGIEIGSKKSKDRFSAHYYKFIIDHLNGIFRLSLRFQNNNSCNFSIKNFEIQGNQFVQTKVAKVTTSTRTDITLQTIVK